MERFIFSSQTHNEEKNKKKAFSILRRPTTFALCTQENKLETIRTKRLKIFAGFKPSRIF